MAIEAEVLGTEPTKAARRAFHREQSASVVGLAGLEGRLRLHHSLDPSIERAEPTEQVNHLGHDLAIGFLELGNKGVML